MQFAAALREKWMAVALSTGPSDHAAAEEAALELYLRLGLRPPEGYVWLDSPLEGIVATTIFRERDTVGGLRMFTDPPSGSIFGRFNEHRREDSPAAFDALRVLCTRATRIVCDCLRRTFPSRRASDSWEEMEFENPAAPNAITSLRMKSDVFTPIREKLLRQRPQWIKAPRWRRALEPFESLERAVGLIRWLSMENMPAFAPGFGTHDAWRLAVCEYLHGVRGVEDSSLAALSEVSRQCGWWWPLRRLVILTERPTTVACETSGRLHAPDGPALAYGDGWRFYAWRGMEVPADFIEQRERRTVRRIEDEYNVELRRAMIEMYGQERFLLDSRARVVHQDEFGILYSVEMFHDEPLVMVEVRNSTPEPDGTHRDYFLRVPPHMRTAREAVAWTFGLEASDYDPSVQT